MTEGVVVRKCDTQREFKTCVELQREIWGEADLEVEPTTLFVVAAHTGGQVLGAFDGSRLVGYTLALAAWRDNRPYLHSHHTGIHPDYRDQGIGRKLKLFQREEALGRGIRLVEWTFDPLEPRNAHFNLNRLGAISRRYLPDLYGRTTSPMHRGLATDRLVAEWHLDTPRVVGMIQGIAPDFRDAPAMIELPAALEQWKRTDLAQVEAVQFQVRAKFAEWFGRGHAAVGFQTANSGSAYLLAPWSDF
jgi:predicted GNAT superfamily acetyltransferase